jgi:sulfite exporter TauE/SafE
MRCVLLYFFCSGLKKPIFLQFGSVASYSTFFETKHLCTGVEGVMPCALLYFFWIYVVLTDFLPNRSVVSYSTFFQT